MDLHLGYGIFTSKQAYQSIIGHYQVATPFQWLQKSCCQWKHKVFFWLLLKDQLNTRNILRHKKFNIPTVDYVLCSNGSEETMKHLFLVLFCSELLDLIAFYLRSLITSHRRDHELEISVSFSLFYGSDHDCSMVNLDT
jgi:hypothetical protein